MQRFGLVLVGALAFGAFPTAMRAEDPIAVHIGAWAQKTTREICGQKAVEAMGIKEKFLFAQVDEDGNARGYSATAAVVVLSVPHQDGIWVGVVAASRNNAEAGRLRDAIRAHIAEGPHDPKVPKEIGKPDAKKKLEVPALAWRVKHRDANALLRFFEAIVCIVFEKQGFGTTTPGKWLVCGSSTDRMAIAFAVPGANALKVHLGVVVAGKEEEDCKQYSQALWKRIVDLLYE